MVALSEKRIETRGQRFGSILGKTVAIHASRAFPGHDQALMDDYHYRHAFARHGITRMQATHADVPRGTIVAVTTVEDIVPIESLLATDSPFPLWKKLVTDQEYAFGIYSPGRWAYILGPVFLMNQFDVFVRGKLGPFDLTEQQERRVLVGIQWNANLPSELTSEDLVAEAIREAEAGAKRRDELERLVARSQGTLDTRAPIERMIDKAVGRG